MSRLGRGLVAIGDKARGEHNGGERGKGEGAKRDQPTVTWSSMWFAL